MNVLLAIDTSLGTSVALSVGDETFEASSDDQRGHAELVGGLIASVFDQSQVSPSRVEAVVAGIGPGPFTGLRIGIAAAKAFATGRGVPLLPLSGHEAVALDACEAAEDPRACSVRVLQDAKRRELFVTEYSGIDDAGLPVCSAESHLLARADYVEEGRDVWPERISPAALLRLARLRLEAGRPFGPDQALYLRSPDVYPSAAPKRVST